MTTYTVATLPRLSSTELSKILLAHTPANLDTAEPPAHIAIVDVRDDDHIGGHIRHSIHAPSGTLDYKIPELVRKLKDKETVVFHCALSQQRGPSAALKYLRERERLIGPPNAGTIGQVLKKNKETASGADEGDWEDVDEPAEQKVYVLDQGFVGWQQRFGEDTRLTEGYRKEIWKDGY